MGLRISKGRLVLVLWDVSQNTKGLEFLDLGYFLGTQGSG